MEQFLLCFSVLIFLVGIESELISLMSCLESDKLQNLSEIINLRGEILTH
ncbi:hypothetical protein RINTHH_3120 [Richelia intracellularis HH01]|uniref:Uncharacterized protein n=1 Tax=Richelia intracellularis HH01 TaxID=1165094 RepID=M1WXR2_9NOST|nr:hypothetical protein RINTHH_3120 [Richelia intracellularis HH01]